MHKNKKKCQNNSKKWEIKQLKKFIILALILFLISSVIGYYVGDKIFNKEKNIVIENVDMITKNDKQDEIITTGGKEIKILPSTKLGIKKKYKECNHISFEFVELPTELINLNKEQVEQKYPEWEIEEFEENKVILFKEVEGICDEHFLIQLGEEFVEIYRIIDKKESKVLYKKTQISSQYLTEEDIEKLKNGIVIYGKDQLNSVIEDYE